MQFASSNPSRQSAIKHGTFLKCCANETNEIRCVGALLRRRPDSNVLSSIQLESTSTSRRSSLAVSDTITSTADAREEEARNCAGALYGAAETVDFSEAEEDRTASIFSIARTR